MALGDKFKIGVQTIINETDIQKQLSKIESNLSKDPIIAKMIIDTANSKQAIGEISDLVYTELKNAFLAAGVAEENIKVTAKDIEKVINNMVSAQDKVKKKAEETAKALKKQAENIKLKIDTGDVDKQLLDVIKRYNELTNKTDELNSNFYNLDSSQKELLKSNTPEEYVKNYNNLQNAIKNVTNELYQLESVEKNIAISEKERNAEKSKSISTEKQVYLARQEGLILNEKLNQSQLDLTNNITKYLTQNKNLSLETKTELDGLLVTLQSIGLTKGELESVSVAFNKITKAVKESEIEQAKAIAIEKELYLSKQAATAEDTRRQKTIEQLAAKQKKMYYDIQIYLTQNTKLTAEFRAQLEALASQLTGSNLSAKGLNDISVKLKTITQQAKVAGVTGRGIFDDFAKNIKQFFTFYLGAGGIISIITSFKKVISTVVSVDTAMTDLKKVTNETNSVYDKFLTNATEKAKQLGATITDLVSATADFARLGYTLDESSQLAEIATLYKNVGDIDIADATESIISTMKAFNITASDSIEIVDKLNEVGKQNCPNLIVI